jgi:aryl-alcohol dehydrogenase-like predicted oxidoreductase
VEEAGITHTLAELDIVLVAYSPLGRGFISGDIKSPDDFAADDFRRTIPRFQGQQFYKNLELLKAIEQMAAEKGITPSQLAIAWVVAKGHLPIPGTKRVKYVEQNIAAANMELSAEEMEKLEAIVPLGASTGDRYNEAGMSWIDQ